MKKFVLLLALTSSLSFANPVTEAGEAFKVKGGTAFIDALLKDRPFETTNQAKDLILNELKTIQSLCGNYQGMELVKEMQISSRVKSQYYTINLEKCPFFLVSETYSSYNNKESVMSFKFNMEMNKILPASIMEGKK